MELQKVRPADAKAELEQARRMPSDTPESRTQRQDAIAIAQAKVRVAK
jgi:hypothetical protein